MKAKIKGIPLWVFIVLLFLELYLEEISDRIIEIDGECQTDEFLDRPPTPLFIPAKTGKDVATQIEEGEVWSQVHKCCQNIFPIQNTFLMQNWSRNRKELILTEHARKPKPNSPMSALRLSAKLRKTYFQLSDTVLRNALFCKTCPAQEGAGNTEIGSRQVLSFSLAVPTVAVGGYVVSLSSTLTT